MNTESQIYQDLRKHLDKLPIGMPVTESGVEIRILQHLFTPEEAKMATELSMIPEPLKRVHKRAEKTGISIKELEQALDHMVSKGAIQVTKKDGEKLYSVIPLAIGMYELQVNRLTKGLAEDMFQYLNEAFGEELHHTKTPQLRTIPVEKSIPVTQEYQVSTYDNIRQIVESAAGPIAVSNCICRQIKDIIGNSCRQTALRETCLLFGDTAEYMLNLGISRSITKEEVFDMLRKAEEAGLVLQPQNTQQPEFVCCCCGDCCGIILSLKKFPRPAELYASNYYSTVDPELCTGCGDCVDICQLDARTMVDSVATVNLDRCIGCGNCIPICTPNATQLQKKDKELSPPKDMDSLYTKIMTQKAGRLNMLKMGMKMLLRLKI